MNKTKITILGSGTCVPSLSRSSCAVLVEFGETKLLLDSGPGTIRRLLETGTTIFDISFLFFSHLHPDHTGELVPFIFSFKYSGEDALKRPFSVIAGKGFSNFFNGLKAVYGDWITLAPDMFNIMELKTEERDKIEFDAFSVESAPTAHSKESIACRITGPDGRSIVYSGDTDFSESLIDLSCGADILICESSMPDKMKIPGHLTPSQAGEIASRAGVKKLVLTHLYPECDRSDIANECSRTYNGKIILAEDLLEIK